MTMADLAVGDDWAYCKLYPGVFIAAIDYLVTAGLDGPIAWPGVANWHFLRMVDDGGPHIRVRLRASPAASAPALEQRLERHLERLVGDVPHMPETTFTPLVAIDGGAGSARLGLGRIRIERERYEPEIPKYGTGPMLFACEIHFRLSSEIARAVIAAELIDGRSRKWIAPHLLAQGIAAFALPRPAAHFLDDYRAYWSQNAPDAIALRERFEVRIDALRRDGIDPLNAALLLSQERELLARWTASIRTVSDLAVRSLHRNRNFADQLIFNLCHLVLNRLGFSALDEAYLARLVHVFGKDAR